MNLLITGAWGQAKENISLIERMGHSVVFMQQEKDDLPCEAGWVEGIICNGLFLYHPIEAFSTLRYIQLTSVGFDRVPMDYVRQHGIEIHNARDVYSIPMSEHAVTCALWFYRGFGVFQRNQQNHIWEKQRYLRELNGKNVLIVGCGNVGKACGKAFGGFGCCVTGIDKNTIITDNIINVMKIDELEKCLSKADIVVLSVPLTPETRNMIGDKQLKSMKDGSLLINLSRGEVVDIESLARHLPRLMGAALDVFSEEPLSKESRLWDIENILITPHNSFVGDGNSERLKKIIIENLESVRTFV